MYFIIDVAPAGGRREGGGRVGGREGGREEGSSNLEREGGMEGGRRHPFYLIARPFGMAVQRVRCSKHLVEHTVRPLSVRVLYFCSE